MIYMQWCTHVNHVWNIIHEKHVYWELCLLVMQPHSYFIVKSILEDLKNKEWWRYVFLVKSEININEHFHKSKNIIPWWKDLRTNWLHATATNIHSSTPSHNNNVHTSQLFIYLTHCFYRDAQEVGRSSGYIRDRGSVIRDRKLGQYNCTASSCQRTQC